MLSDSPHSKLIHLLRAALVSACLFATPALGFQPVAGKAIGTFLHGLPTCARCIKLVPDDSRINQWAQIATKPGGTKKINKELGQMKLPQEVLDDIYTRILVAQGRLERKEAAGFMRRLNGVPGFGSALSKSMGASPANTIGHLNEVRIANNAALLNFKIVGVGVKFSDPNKKGFTDIDVLLEKNGRQIAIEAKDYPATARVPLDLFRADMLTLHEFRKANPQHNVLPVFWITNKPADTNRWRLIEMAAEQHGVKLLVGSPDMAIHQLPLLFH